MLELVRIKNLVVIDEAEISFSHGLNILSGETGAGKSIVIQAISLLLGGRVTQDLIRAGCEDATVEGLFMVSGIPWIRERLAKFGFASDASQLLIKRVVNSSGRHRIYINGELATLGILQELTESLVDLCSQHEHQSLVKSTIQLDLLDRYGGLESDTEEMSGAFSNARALRQEMMALSSSEEERIKRGEFLKFQIDEIQATGLQPGEDEILQNKKKLYQSIQQRVQLGNEVEVALAGNDEFSGIFDLIKKMQQNLEKLYEIDPSLSHLGERVERAVSEMEDVNHAIQKYLMSVEMNPEEFEQVQERLALIANLKRKYGASVSDILASFEKISAEYLLLSSSEERLSRIMQDLEAAESHLLELGRKLSTKRKKVAKVFSQSVTSELKDLNMAEAQFKIEISSRESLEEWTVKGGADVVQFLVQANPGEPANTLAKVASGGELSRIMLSIRRVISDKGGIGVYLFDEIDSGIGGQTAFQVGKKLKSVSKFNQVICITHLPQVAAFADQHLSVRKEVKGKRTMTEVVKLDLAERKNELARMLGGSKVTPASLKNAADLIQMSNA